MLPPMWVAFCSWKAPLRWVRIQPSSVEMISVTSKLSKPKKAWPSEPLTGRTETPLNSTSKCTGMPQKSDSLKESVPA